MAQRRYTDTASSTEELVGIAADLTDEDIRKAGQVLYQLQQKYSQRANTVENLDQLRDEGLTKLAEIGLLATFDPTPCFYGEPPALEILGKVAGHVESREGFDHERKAFEVKRATDRGEEFLGQKETPDAGPARRRDRDERKKKQ